MKIERVEVMGIRIPYLNPIKFFVGTRTVGDYLVLKIETDEGAYGIGGSGALWPVVSGESLKGAIQILEEYFIPHALLGEDPFNIARIIRQMDRLCKLGTMTKSAVDFALHDLMGRVCNVPVYKLFGGAQRDEIPQEWIVMLGTPEQMVEDALKYIDAGYVGIKFKWDGNIDLDIERTRALREALGPDVELCVDANQAYNADQAIRVINATEKYNMKFVEQPVHRDDLDGFAHVRRNVTTPLAADEGCWTVSDAWTHLTRGLIDYVHAAPSRTGGLWKLRQYCTLAEAAHVRPVFSIYNSPALEFAASAHFSFAQAPRPFADEIVGIFNVHGGTSTDDIKEGITDRVNPPLRNGRLLKPEGPGFGMELNMEYITKHAVHHKSYTRKDVG